MKIHVQILPDRLNVVVEQDIYSAEIISVVTMLMSVCEKVMETTVAQMLHVVIQQDHLPVVVMLDLREME